MHMTQGPRETPGNRGQPRLCTATSSATRLSRALIHDLGHHTQANTNTGPSWHSDDAPPSLHSGPLTPSVPASYSATQAYNTRHLGHTHHQPARTKGKSRSGAERAGKVCISVFVFIDYRYFGLCLHGGGRDYLAATALFRRPRDVQGRFPVGETSYFSQG